MDGQRPDCSTFPGWRWFALHESQGSASLQHFEPRPGILCDQPSRLSRVAHHGQRNTQHKPAPAGRWSDCAAGLGWKVGDRHHICAFVRSSLRVGTDSSLPGGVFCSLAREPPLVTKTKSFASCPLTQLAISAESAPTGKIDDYPTWKVLLQSWCGQIGR